MQHVIKALKWASRNDDQELTYLNSEVIKRKSRLEEAKEELEEIIKKRDLFIEMQKEVKDFIALHDTENNNA